MNKIFPVLLLFAVTACGSPSTSSGPPMVEVQGTSTVLKSVQVIAKTRLRNSSLGITATMPSFKASYLYSSVTARANRKPDWFRVDMPGSLFRDGRARVSVNRAARYLRRNSTTLSVEAAESGSTVYFADTMQPDTETTRMVSAEGILGDTLDMSASVSEDPFAMVSSESFRAAAVAEGYSVTASPEAATAQRTVLIEGGSWRQTLFYSAADGAVTRIEDVVEAEAVSEVTNTVIKYLRVGQIPSMTVPYEITSTKVTKPKGGLVIAGGSMTTEQTTTYSDIKINTLNDDYFPGGN